MRQMKRALSLALAMVMLLGMVMVAPASAASSNFIDAELIENEDAVEITSGIGLFAGTTDGRFAPKATVTRAQMATIIVKMLRGNDFNADAFKGVGVNPFPDTASFEGGWAEGYINACYQLGAVAGYGNGTFQPGNELTTAEAITMIINALGVDPGPGDWPINYMAKAEEMKLYGDLESKPAADEPLNRDQLAVIVLAGLEYSPEGKSGYRIPDSELVFTEYVDAFRANGNDPDGITEAVGEDSLASKVYELKKMTGFITGNQATGLDHTELSFLNAAETGRDTPAKFDIETSLDVIGHYVTIYYKEKYTNEDKPGLTYAIVDDCTAVTVREKVTSAKEYKTVFGQSYDTYSKYVVRFDDEYGLDTFVGSLSTSEYTRGANADAGTYIISGGVIRAYIEPVPVFATYILDIGTAAGEEYVSMTILDAAGMKVTPQLSTVEGSEEVIGYTGMKSGDFVTYQKVHDLYVLSPVEKITGDITKTATPTINGNPYNSITIDEEEYLSFEPAGESDYNLIGSKLDNDLDEIEYNQSYELYLTKDGSFVGFKPVTGVVSMEHTVYLLGAIVVNEQDDYGKWIAHSKARGVDMEGNEILLSLGKLPVADKTATVTPASNDDPNCVGTLYNNKVSGMELAQGFYTYKDNTQNKDTKKEGLKELTAYASAYSPATPSYVTAPWMDSTFSGGTTSIGTKEGIPSVGQSSMKILIISGTVDQSDPLTASVYTGSISPAIQLSKTDTSKTHRMLVTRNADGARSTINIFVEVAEDANYAKSTYIYLTQEQIESRAQVEGGVSFTTSSLENGSDKEFVIVGKTDASSGLPVNDAGAVITTGFNEIQETDEAGRYKLITPGVLMKAPLSQDGESEDYSVYSNMGFWGLTGSRLRAERMAGASGSGHSAAIDMISPLKYNNSGANTMPVVDIRTDEELKRDGVGKIESTTQLASLRESDPGLMVIFDLAFYGKETKNTAKIMFVKRVVRGTPGMNSIVYLDGSAPTAHTGDPAKNEKDYYTVNAYGVRALNANLAQEDVVVKYERALPGNTSLQRGFYRYGVDADGNLTLVPFDGNVAVTGTYGMVGIHNEFDAAKSSATKLVTLNSHSGCELSCGSDKFEALTTVNITKDTLILGQDWKPLGDTQAEAMDKLKEMAADGKVYLDYYCDAPVSGSNDGGRDETVELIVVYSAQQRGQCPDHDKATNKKLTARTSALADGTTYYIETGVDAISARSKITVGSGVSATLCLNDRALNAPTDISGAFITVEDGGTLTVCGGKYGVGEISGGNAEITGIEVKSGGTLNLESGSIAKFNNSGVKNAGTVNLNGGSISGNTSANNGGGVVNSGIFNLNGGTISGNNVASTKHGAGIYNQGTLNLISGEISGNMVSGTSAKGGGIYTTGQVTMNGTAIIKNNKSENSTGGGVHIETGTFTLTKGTITGNTANQYGGGVAVQNGTLNVTGGEIQGNKATNSNPYGIDVACGYNSSVVGTVNISGGVIGAANSGTSSRNLTVCTGTTTITGGVVYGAVGTVGMYSKDSSLIVENGAIYGDVSNGTLPLVSADKGRGTCTATISGGEVYGTVTDTVITGGAFKNRPDVAGAGVTQRPDGMYVVSLMSCSEHYTDGFPEDHQVKASTTVLNGGTWVLTDSLTATGKIRVTADTTLCLNDRTLTAPDGLDSEFIAVSPQVTLTICGGNAGLGVLSGQGGVGIMGRYQSGVKLLSGSISGFDVPVSSDIFTMTGGVLNGGVTGGTIDGGTLNGSVTNATINSGVINGTVNGGTIAGGTFSSTSKVSGGTITGGTFDGEVSGGTITGGTFDGEVSGGTITGGTVNGTVTGGAVISDAAVITGTVTGDSVIKGGTITGEVVGAIVDVGADTEFALAVNGGTIKSGIFTNPVYDATIEGGTINGEVSGGTITGGTINGEVYDATIQNGEFSATSQVSGGQIQNGTFNGEVVGADIKGGTFHSAVSDSVITGGIFTNMDKAELEAQAEGYNVITNPDGSFTLEEKPEEEEPPVVCSLHGDHDGWTAISNTNGKNRITAAGKYYLTENITAAASSNTNNGAIIVATLYKTDVVTLCMNGHNIAPTDSGIQNALRLEKGALTIYNGCTEGGNITGSAAHTGGRAMQIGTNSNTNQGTVTLENNVHVTGSNVKGTVIQLSYGCTLTLNSGATINDNVTASAGGTLRNMGGTVVLNEGSSITNNQATNSDSKGGAIYLHVQSSNKPTLTINGGTISGNSAYRGGGIYVDAAGCTVNMYGGTITNNTATDQGSNVYIMGGDFNMTGGSISSVDKACDGVYVGAAGVLDVSGDAEIAGSVGTGTGKMTFNGVVIDGDVIDRDTVGDATIEITDCVVNGAVTGSTIKGGTFNSPVSNCTIYDGVFYKNVTGGTISGGEFKGYVSSAALCISGGTFNGEENAKEQLEGWLMDGYKVEDISTADAKLFKVVPDSET